MAYGVLATVKLLVRVTTDDFDDELSADIDTADHIIDNALERCGATVPLTSPDDLIPDISNYLAAGLFKQKDVPDEKPHSFYTLGQNMLREYIATNYLDATPPGTTTAPITNQSIAYGVGLAT